MGLGHRYGRRMQTISGIHYNWSLPGLSEYRILALIRNFRRHAFLLMTLFGASPAVCSTFVEGRPMACSRCPVAACTCRTAHRSDGPPRLSKRCPVIARRELQQSGELRRIVAGRIDTALSSV